MGELAYYFDGYFVSDPRMRYVNGKLEKYFNVDADMLDYWELIRLGRKTGRRKADKEIEGLLLHYPGTPFEEGLLKVTCDKEVLEVGKVVEKYGVADLYVVEKKTFAKMGSLEVFAHGESSGNSKYPLVTEIPSHVSPTNIKEVVDEGSGGKETCAFNINPPNEINPDNLPNQNKSAPIKKTSSSKPPEVLTSEENPSQPTQIRSTAQILGLLLSQSTRPDPIHCSPTTRSKANKAVSEKPPEPPFQISTRREKLPIKSTKKPEYEAPKSPTVQLKNPSIKSPSKKPKTPPQKQIPTDYDVWFDNRPESPIPFDQLVGIGDLSTEGSDYLPSGDGSCSDDDDELVSHKSKARGHTEEQIIGTRKEELCGKEIVIYKGGTSRGVADAEVGDGDNSDVEDDYEFEERSVSWSDTSDEEFTEAANHFNQWVKRRKEREEAVKVQVLHNLKPSDQAGHGDAEGFESEYDDSEEDDLLAPIEESDDEGRPKARLRAPLVTKATDFSKLKWVPGIRFPNRAAFRDAITRYALAQGRNLVIAKSDKNRGNLYVVRCKGECKFHLHASWDNKEQAFLVKSVKDTHECTRDIMSNRQLKSKWVANEMIELFKLRPHLPAKEIVDCIKKSFNIAITRALAYKIKHVAHTMLHGSMQDHYGKVGRYIQALLQHNPSSIFLVDSVPPPSAGPPVFRRMFICFEGLKNGFVAGCRKFLCLDGCFLKTFLRGILLVAIGRDGNNEMFPVAWAVAEGENTESWEWFLMNIRQVFDGTNGGGWTLMSDQQKGLINAVARVFPDAEHRNCAKHIHGNWSKTYKGDELKTTFWEAASAYCQSDFQKAMDNMKRLSPEAAEAFIGQQPRTFCRSFFDSTTKCDLVVNNLAESFNSFVVEARCKHLLYMLEDIRHALMERLSRKREWIKKSPLQICPKIQKKLEKSKQLASQCSVAPSSGFLYEVKHGLDDLVVNLETKSCTCRRWDLTGIPCAHAAATATFLRQPPENFIHPLLTKESYLLTYNHSIGPCVGEKHWPESDMVLAPPHIKAMPGRPRKTRYKGAHEDPKNPGKLTRHGVVMHCSVCKSTQHNKRKCTAKDNAEPPQKKKT